MDYDILKSISQRGNNAQDAENSRIAAIADELYRLCKLHETQSGIGQADVTPFIIFSSLIQHTSFMGLQALMDAQFNQFFVKLELLMLYLLRRL